MRVVFTGTSGTDNRHVVRRLADYITRQHGRKVAVIEAERELREMGAGEYYQFLDSIPSNDAARQWSQSVKGAISEWAQENRRSGEPEFSFLSMHLVFQVRSHFHCPINWSYPTGDAGGITKGELLELLREFNPHLFINLIDNVYSLQRRIKDYPFRLIELLRWRNVETLMTDIVASLVTEEKDRIRETPENISRYKYERSPILAVRHPTEMAYRLISDEGRTRIYMAYPISEPRTVHRTTGDDRLIRQINAFRDYMRAHFVAFDPVTIDERPLKFLWEAFVTEKRKNLRNKRSLTKDALIKEVYSLIAGDTTLSLAEKDTWPVDPAEYQHMLCGPLDHYRSRLRSKGEENEPSAKPVTFELMAGEVRRVVEEKIIWVGTRKGGEIDNQIARRDYRLIDQVDCVVIYRPTMRRPAGWNLGGTRLEYEYAKRTQKPALVIRDEKDGPFEDPPFDTNVNPWDVLEWSGLDCKSYEERQRRQEECLREAVSLINERAKIKPTAQKSE